MRPVLLSLGGVRVHSYPAMVYLGLVFGLTAENPVARAAGLATADVFAATILLLIPALLGARLLFVVEHWAIYRREPRRTWRRSEGGAAMYGGLALALPISVPLLAALDVPFWAFWDVATFPLLIGTVFARIGCLLHGCCAGRPTSGPFGLDLPDHRGIRRRRLPTQLLEAGWATLLLVGVVAVWGQRPFDGAVYLSALTGYGLGRVALELTREDHESRGVIRLPHVVSAALVVLSVATFALLRPR